MIAKPNGLTELIVAFGDPIRFANDKRNWERTLLKTMPLTEPLPYAYGDARITQVTAHWRVVAHLVDTLRACLAAGVPATRLHYGGCYSWRPKRTNGTQLSTHAWGIAVDVEPAANPLGKAWADDGVMLHPKAVETFEAMGWTWGGRWARPDPMHAQFCDYY